MVQLLTPSYFKVEIEMKSLFSTTVTILQINYFGKKKILEKKILDRSTGKYFCDIEIRQVTLNAKDEQ